MALWSVHPHPCFWQRVVGGGVVGENESSNSRIVERRSVEGEYIAYFGLNSRSYISQLKICMYMKTKGCEYKPLIGYPLDRPTIRQTDDSTIRG